nr:MAG TPA: hypothetical protein [Caudoviricetes sp.]
MPQEIILRLPPLPLTIPLPRGRTKWIYRLRLYTKIYI